MPPTTSPSTPPDSPSPVARISSASPSLTLRCALALLRALRSAAIIVIVALLAVGLRDGNVRWSHLGPLATTYRSLFALVFIALLVWELLPRPRA